MLGGGNEKTTKRLGKEEDIECRDNTYRYQKQILVTNNHTIGMELETSIE